MACGIWPDGIQFHPNLTTTTKPRRSPRKHNSSETAAKQHPLSKGNGQPKIGNQSSNNNVPNLNTTTTPALITGPTATSKAAAKSSPKSRDKAKAVVQFNHGINGGPKSADPAKLYTTCSNSSETQALSMNKSFMIRSDFSQSWPIEEDSSFASTEPSGFRMTQALGSLSCRTDLSTA